MFDLFLNNFTLVVCRLYNCKILAEWIKEKNMERIYDLSDYTKYDVSNMLKNEKSFSNMINQRSNIVGVLPQYRSDSKQKELISLNICIKTKRLLSYKPEEYILGFRKNRETIATCHYIISDNYVLFLAYGANRQCGATLYDKNEEFIAIFLKHKYINNDILISDKKLLGRIKVEICKVDEKEYKIKTISLPLL